MSNLLRETIAVQDRASPERWFDLLLFTSFVFSYFNIKDLGKMQESLGASIKFALNAVTSPLHVTLNRIGLDGVLFEFRDFIICDYVSYLSIELVPFLE